MWRRTLHLSDSLPRRVPALGLVFFWFGPYRLLCLYLFCTPWSYDARRAHSTIFAVAFACSLLCSFHAFALRLALARIVSMHSLRARCHVLLARSRSFCSCSSLRFRQRTARFARPVKDGSQTVLEVTLAHSSRLSVRTRTLWLRPHSRPFQSLRRSSRRNCSACSIGQSSIPSWLCGAHLHPGLRSTSPRVRTENTRPSCELLSLAIAVTRKRAASWLTG